MKLFKIRTFFLLLVNIFFVLTASNAFSETKKESKKLTPITLQLMWKHQFEFAGFYAAIEKGYYQQLGLDVKTREFQQGIDLVDDVMSGRAQFGISDSSLLIDRSNGASVVLLANVFQHSPMVLLSLAQSQIYSPAQMIGKSMMLSAHEKNNASLIAMLKSESVSLKQIEIKEHSFNLDDLVNGNVDIVSAYATNEPGELNQKQIKYNIIDPINYGIDFYGNNIFTSEAEIRENPQQVENFIKASLKGWEYALDHPDEIIELILSKYASNKTREALSFEAQALRRYILSDHIPLGTVDKNRIARVVDTYQQLNMLPKDFILDGFLYQSLNKQDESLKLTEQQRTWIKQNPDVIIGVDPGWPPFEFIDEKGRYSGMAADYIELISKKTGINFVLQDNKTWQSVMNSARSGKLDLLAAVMKSEQRNGFLDFAIPHIKYPMVIVTSKDDDFISSVEELKHKMVTVVKGYVTEDLFRLNHPGIKLIPVDDLQQALKLVSSGEVDALVDNLASITHSISRLGITNLRISGTTPYEFALSLAVTKEQTALLVIIQAALDSISEREHLEIRNKWISVNYSQPIDYKKIIIISSVVFLIMVLILIWNWRLAREVKARKTVENALRNSESKFRNLVENTNIVAWEVDLETLQFVYVSPHAEQMLGYPLEDWKKENFWIDNIAEDDRGKSVSYCMNETKKGRDHSFEYRMLKANGESIWLRDIVTVNKDSTGKAISLSGVFVDIDESKKYAHALEKAKQEAERANIIKSEFLATMSHELRTPMNGVLGMTELLKETALTKDQQDKVDIILRSGNSLLAIINDVLDLSKLEAEQVTLETSSFNLERLSQDVLDMFIAESELKKINISLDYPSHYPRYFLGDSLRLQQVLINLLGNAIKFTAEGSICLTIYCQQHENRQVVLTLSVQDSGIGISAENITKLFVPFIQADQTTTRQFGGTGLGLAISKKLVELMNGKMGVESELGKGSKFWFTLSLPLADEVQLNVNQHTTDRLGKNQLTGKVLLVEDDKINQLVAKGILTKVGLEIDIAEDGKQALNLWKKGEYDLILMDCRMPVMDGYTAAKLIRTQETDDTQIPIIALTANSSPEDKRRCIEAGMNDVITKPFKTKFLVKRLEHWLSSIKETKNENAPIIASKHNELIDKSIKQELSLDSRQLEKFRNEMDEDYEQIVEVILQGFDEFFIQFGDNDLTDNFHGAANFAHDLKSRGAHLGAINLARLAAEIEQLADKKEVSALCEKIKHLKEEYKRVKIELSIVET